MRGRRLLVALAAASVVAAGSACEQQRGESPRPGAASAAASPVGRETADGTRYSEQAIQIGGEPALVLVPAATPQGSDAVLAVVAHGAGGTEQSVNGPLMARTRDALLDQGWIVASAMAGDRAWGNEEALADYAELAEWVRGRWTVTDVLLHGYSMGGLASLLLYVQERIPDIRAAALVAPVLSLEAMHATPGFAGDLERAYSVDDGAELLDVTRHRDPVRLDPAELRGTRLALWVSDGDTLVPPAEHADVFVRRFQDDAAVLEVTEVEGSHQDPALFQPGEVVAFYEQALQAS